MTEFDTGTNLDEFSEQQLQYHIHRLFTALARRQDKIRECEQVLSMLNMTFYKYKR